MFAYRGIFARPAPYVLWIAYFSFAAGKAVVQRAYGMLLGAKAANNQYSRFPRAACTACAIFFLGPVHHYVDAFMNGDVAQGRNTTQECLRAVLNSWGGDEELTKRQANATSNVVLGGRINVSRAQSEGIVSAEPEGTKVEKLLKQLEDCAEQNFCAASTADNIVGKTRWMTSQHFMHMGAAALQPFAQRARGGDPDDTWTPAMQEALEYIKVIFSEEFKPRLEVKLKESDADRAEDKDCILLFTDCAEENEGKDGALFKCHVEGVTERVDRVSFFAYDKRDKSCHSGHGTIPAEFRREYFKVRKTYIGVGEEVAAVGALFSAPKLFRGRRVIHFVDNAGSLLHLVNGYAGQPDSARIVNLFHIAVAALGIHWWGEWIPSKANIADIMTRPGRFFELQAGLGASQHIHKHEFKMPPLGDDSVTLTDWMRAMRAKE